MTWHRLPRDDAWRQVTLDHVATVQTDTLWLRCNGCGHSVDEPIAAFRARTGLPGDTPLLLIAPALVCSRCGDRKAHCWARPYSVRT